MARRIRKHTNPFNVTTRLGVLDRRALFGREAQLEIDLGCGSAGFLFERAAHHPERDFIGLEVRKLVVEQAMARRERDKMQNLIVFHASSAENIALAEPGAIRMFSIQFPDPCFKKRHRKRRILQPRIVRAMSTILPIGGLIYAQSDVKPLAEEMFDFLTADGALDSTLPGLESPSPFEERTEWERHHEKNAEPIYRMLFEKKREPAGPIPELELRDTDPARTAEG